MKLKAVMHRDEIAEFISSLYDGDLHAKRVLSLANATLGVLTSASPAVHLVGQGLAQALGKLSKHGIAEHRGRSEDSSGARLLTELEHASLRFFPSPRRIFALASCRNDSMAPPSL